MAKEDRFEVVLSERNTFSSPAHTMILKDTVTGVHYLFVHDGHAGGLTPLLGREGNPVVGSIQP